MKLGGIALVTGAASGIGRSTAIAYADAGVDGLFISDIVEEGLEKTRDEITAKYPGLKVEAKAADVAKEAEVEALVDELVNVFGRLDYAANVAGIAERVQTLLADTSTATFQEVQDINVGGVFFALRAEIRVMKQQEPVARIPGRKAIRGSIVNISSITSERVCPGLSSYTVSKHAVSGLTRSAPFTHSVDRITINAVAPGFIFTGMSYPVQIVTDWIEDATPMGRYGKAEEIADVVVFLSSPRTSSITGQVWYADGGFSVCSKGARDEFGSFVAPYTYPSYVPQR